MTKKAQRVTKRRFVMYLDPKICPACGEPATVVFGARRYCGDCAARLSAPTVVPIAEVG